MIKGLGADLRHALRLYRATPAASLIAVAVLAIGMAFVAAFVSLYVDLILRPHPGFERGPGIVNYGFNNGQNAGGLPYELIERVQNEVVSLEVAAGIAGGNFLIGEEQEQAYGEIVTTQYFDGMKPRLALGRGLDLSDHTVDAEPVIVISHQLWQTRFNGREDVLGLTLQIGASQQFFFTGGQLNPPNQQEREPTDFRIVGVMSARITESLASPGRGPAAFWMAVERAVPVMLGRKSVRERFAGAKETYGIEAIMPDGKAHLYIDGNRAGAWNGFTWRI